MRIKNKLVFGVATNDANYEVRVKVDYKPVMCEFYQTWVGMLRRCYDSKYQSRKPTYIGCTVCEEWLTFSKFKAWMGQQDWQGKQLDKDILVKGNKVYSPDTCVFVDMTINLFITDSKATRGDYPIGVSWNKSSSKFMAQCRNPFKKSGETVGRFSNPEQAHQAWKARKHELALQLADLQDDERVAQALRTRYAPS